MFDDAQIRPAVQRFVGTHIITQRGLGVNSWCILMIVLSNIGRRCGGSSKALKRAYTVRLLCRASASSTQPTSNSTASSIARRPTAADASSSLATNTDVASCARCRSGSPASSGASPSSARAGFWRGLCSPSLLLCSPCSCLSSCLLLGGPSLCRLLPVYFFLLNCS